MIYTIASSIYNHKALSSIKEIISNALDSFRDNKDNHNVNTKGVVISVKIKTGYTDENINKLNISVKDYGGGIPHNRFIEIFGTLGSSTKTNSSSATGAFGLGCKSPFAVTKKYYVLNRHKGVQKTYYCNNNDFNLTFKAIEHRFDNIYNYEKLKHDGIKLIWDFEVSNKDLTDILLYLTFIQENKYIKINIQKYNSGIKNLIPNIKSEMNIYSTNKFLLCTKNRIKIQEVILLDSNFFNFNTLYLMQGTDILPLNSFIDIKDTELNTLLISILEYYKNYKLSNNKHFFGTTNFLLEQYQKDKHEYNELVIIKGTTKKFKVNLSRETLDITLSEQSNFKKFIKKELKKILAHIENVNIMNIKKDIKSGKFKREFIYNNMIKSFINLSYDKVTTLSTFEFAFVNMQPHRTGIHKLDISNEEFDSTNFFNSQLLLRRLRKTYLQENFNKVSISKLDQSINNTELSILNEHITISTSEFNKFKTKFNNNKTINLIFKNLQVYVFEISSITKSLFNVTKEKVLLNFKHYCEKNKISGFLLIVKNPKVNSFTNKDKTIMFNIDNFLMKYSLPLESTLFFKNELYKIFTSILDYKLTTILTKTKEKKNNKFIKINKKKTLTKAQALENFKSKYTRTYFDKIKNYSKLLFTDSILSYYYTNNLSTIRIKELNSNLSIETKDIFVPIIIIDNYHKDSPLGYAGYSSTYKSTMLNISLNFKVAKNTYLSTNIQRYNRDIKNTIKLHESNRILLVTYKHFIDACKYQSLIQKKTDILIKFKVLNKLYKSKYNIKLIIKEFTAQLLHRPYNDEVYDNIINVTLHRLVPLFKKFIEINELKNLCQQDDKILLKYIKNMLKKNINIEDRVLNELKDLKHNYIQRTYL